MKKTVCTLLALLTLLAAPSAFAQEQVAPSLTGCWQFGSGDDLTRVAVFDAGVMLVQLPGTHACLPVRFDLATGQVEQGPFTGRPGQLTNVVVPEEGEASFTMDGLRFVRLDTNPYLWCNDLGPYALMDFSTGGTVPLGTLFYIIRRENPTTGYSYGMTLSPETGVVRLLSDYFEPDAVDGEEIPGAGGSHLYFLMSEGSGDATVTFTATAPGADTPEDAEVLELIVK